MRAKDTSNEQFELTRLRQLSGRLGRDRQLVQASSGNTSIKIGGVLWVKASGKWLIEAETPDFLIPVQLARARRCLKEETAIPETETNSSGDVCASIETAMHTVLPQKVVVHVHSVNALAWAVREDAPTQLSKRLSGFHWQWIPYTCSGAALAISVQHVLSCFPSTNVLVLGNHGLVVCGESCDSTEQLLAEVERCLEVEPRPTPEPDAAALRELMARSDCSLPKRAEVHALVTDPISRKILSGGVLYPCQAIFLPSTVPAIESFYLKQLSFFRQHRRPLLLDERGVLCSKDMTRAEQETLIGLTDVVQRIDSSAPLRYLSLSEVMDIFSIYLSPRAPGISADAFRPSAS